MCNHFLDPARFRSAAITSDIIDRLPYIAPHARSEMRAFLAGGIAADLVRDDAAVTDETIRAALRGYEARWPGAFQVRSAGR